MATFLKKETADAICTMIFLGYFTDPKLSGKIHIEYSEPDEIDQHNKVSECLKKIGLNANFTQSVSQDEFPFILALSKTDPDLSTARAHFQSNNLINYLKAIQSAAEPSKPYGAYIGGELTASSLNLIGPSVLRLSTPVYRDPENAENAEFFAKYKENINNAISAMKTPINRNVVKGLDVKTQNFDQLTGNYENGKVINSYHGLIQAICTFPTSDKGVYFEIALGPKTKKVSSCMPCSLFMAANNCPASSTHLGRGDYWNVPSNAGALRSQWASCVANWFVSGKKFSNVSPKLGNAIKIISDNGVSNEKVADVFLEALTFPGSFADKILNTLN